MGLRGDCRWNLPQPTGLYKREQDLLAARAPAGTDPSDRGQGGLAWRPPVQTIPFRRKMSSSAWRFRLDGMALILVGILVGFRWLAAVGR